MRKTIHLFEKWDKASQTDMRSEKLSEDSGPREAPPSPWNGLPGELVSLCSGRPLLTTPWEFHMEKGLEPECSGWKGTEWPCVSLQSIVYAIFENTCPCVCPPYFSNHIRMHDLQAVSAKEGRQTMIKNQWRPLNHTWVQISPRAHTCNATCVQDLLCNKPVSFFLCYKRIGAMHPSMWSTHVWNSCCLCFGEPCIKHLEKKTWKLILNPAFGGAC